MGFLATLARQSAWYPEVYSRPELCVCAKCKQPGETQEHLYACADHRAVKGQFLATIRGLEPRGDLQADMISLRPWSQMGGLQGRVHPQWTATIPLLLQVRPRPTSPSVAIQQLLRASLETWYLAIWLPRCQRTIEQERSQGLHQGAKIRRMRAARGSRTTNAPTSPTPNLPRSFIDSIADRMAEYHGFVLRLMEGGP
jgi:hypothetical protein